MPYGVPLSIVGKVGIVGLDLVSNTSIRVFIIIISSLIPLISSIIYASIVLSFAGGVFAEINLLAL